MTTLDDDKASEDVPLASPARSRAAAGRKQVNAAPSTAPKGKNAKAAKPPPKSATTTETPTSVTAKGKGRQAPVIDLEEEELDFGQPARQGKRRRVSPRPAATALAPPPPSSSSSIGLALPSSRVSSSFTPTLPGPPQTQEEEDDEWDDVLNAVASAAPGAEDASIFRDGPGGDAEGEEIEIDLNQFAADLDQELGGALSGIEEDALGDEGSELFGFEGDEAEATEVSGRPRPISLNQFAGGAGVEQDDDDYSSSEESDED